MAGHPWVGSTIEFSFIFMTHLMQKKSQYDVVRSYLGLLCRPTIIITQGRESVVNVN